jgi:hypothetical protein
MKAVVKIFTFCLLISFIAGCGGTPAATTAPETTGPVTTQAPGEG